MDRRGLATAVTLASLLVAASAVARERPDAAALSAQANQQVEAEVGAVVPELLPKLREAERAREKDEKARAQQLYAELHERLPAVTSVTRRLCRAELRLDHRERALELCREAARDGTATNLMALADVLVETPEGRDEALQLIGRAVELEPLNPWARMEQCLIQHRAGTLDAAENCNERLGNVVPAAWLGPLTASLVSRLLRDHEPARARRVIDAAIVDFPSDPAVQAARASVALEENDLDTLGAATMELRKLAPREPQTFVLTAIEQASRGKFSDAEVSLATAERLGASHQKIAQLHASFEAAKPWYARFLLPAAAILAGWAIGLVALYFGGALLSAAALRASRAPPSAGSGTTEMSTTLRTAYRTLLWVSSVYYFVSIPVVVALVLAIAAVPLILMLWIGYVLPKLLVVLGLVVLGTLGAFAKSILARRQDRDPGLRLDLPRYPELSRLLDEVAGHVGTRGADTVFMSPDANLAVFERGGILAQLRGRSERCLILGVALLDGMPLDQLRSVLAHEFGHFSNRDTAGGGFALAVRRSLLLTAEHLARGGAATFLNPAWLFVNGYHRLFLRMSQGASRLQEVLADRFAALAYGSESFVAGLLHVIRRDVEFEHHANATVHDLLQVNSPLKNLYRHVPSAVSAESTLEQGVREALERPGSPYDSHPPPRARIEYVRQLAVTGPRTEASNLPAWSLFPDREQLEQALTGHFLDRVAEATGHTNVGR